MRLQSVRVLLSRAWPLLTFLAREDSFGTSVAILTSARADPHRGPLVFLHAQVEGEQLQPEDGVDAHRNSTIWSELERGAARTARAHAETCCISPRPLHCESVTNEAGENH